MLLQNLEEMGLIQIRNNMTNILILAISLLAILRCDQDRYALLVFSFGCIYFQFIGSYFSGQNEYLYFAGAATTDLIIINYLSKIINLTCYVLYLQKICLMFIFVSLFGWIMYESSYRAHTYDTICDSLYLLTLFISIQKGRKDEFVGPRYNTIYSNGNVFWCGHHSGLVKS